MATPEGTHFAAVRALFEAALDLAPAERRAFVEREARDPEARAEALELLAELESEASELPLPDPRELASWLDGDAGLPRPGASVAGYEIVRAIGEGGMGRVYEAREASPPRRVALKMMRSGLGTAASQRRFEIEAEVLARLLHPGIAQVYASGLWRDSQLAGAPPRPWFAMEFVSDARALTRHVAERGLALSARLRLFLELCEAVEHAHQRGVIHRDLKPANVLVDGEGRIKVIDFGIARVEGATGESLHTRHGEVLGTLATMSPEQAQGHWDEVDVRTDVYALGVLLYELVANRAPYELAGLSLASAVRVVCESPPAPPSSRGHGRPAVPSDLDWIALRALAKERERRYASVSELAADVRRFLADEPVLAGPPTLRYRAGKFLRRNRLAVGAAALVLLSLVGGLIVASIERGRAVAAAESSRRDADHAAFINAFLLDTLGSPDPWVSGPDVRVRELIDSALETIRVDLADRPELAASLLAALGRTYAGLSLYERAEEVLSEAVGGLEARFGSADPRTLEARADRVDALLGLARHREALSEATHLQEDAATTLGPDDPLVHAARQDRAQALAGSGELTEALEAARTLLADSERVFGPDHEETVGARRTLAGVYAERGEVLEAERLSRECLASLERTLAPDHPDVLRASRALAETLVSRRVYDEARELLERTLEAAVLRFGEEHTATLATLVDLSALHLHRRDLAEAERVGDRALALARARLASDHPLLLQAMAVRADLYVLTGERELAEQLYLELLPFRRRDLPDVHSLRAETESGYATLLFEDGRWAEAAEGYRRAVAATPPESRFVALAARHGLGIALLSQGQSEEAIAELEACLAGRLELSGAQNDDVIDTMTILSRAYLERGDTDRARALADEVVAGRAAIHGGEALKTAEALNNLAVVQQEQGEYAQAESALRDVLSVFRERLGESHPTTLRAWNNLGLCLHYAARHQEALDAYLEGLSYGVAELGESHPAVCRLYLNLAELHLQTGADEEALALFDAILAAERERASAGSLSARYAMSGRGRALKRLGRLDEAAEQAEITLEVLRTALGDSHWESQRAALEAVRARRASGALADAAALAQEAARTARAASPRAADLHPRLELEAAELLLLLGRPDSAEEHVRAAHDASLAPGADPALLSRAEAALAALEQALRSE